MAKDPAFLFYPGDWLGGTMGFNFELKGCYMELLIFQFNNKGKFTKAQAKQVLNGSYDVAWPLLQHKFVEENGFYHNKRLKVEVEKRERFTNSRKNNALGGKNKKALAKHIENRDKDGNEIENYNGIQWDEVKKKWGKDFRWKEKICVDFKIEMRQAEIKMVEFLTDLELKEDYKDVPGLKRHFVNWYKKHHGSTTHQPISPNGSGKQGTSAAREQALRNW